MSYKEIVPQVKDRENGIKYMFDNKVLNISPLWTCYIFKKAFCTKPSTFNYVLQI